MENFSEKQNIAFSKLFGHLKVRNNIECTVIAALDMNEENFTTLYLDKNTTIIGTDIELVMVEQRAKNLGITK